MGAEGANVSDLGAFIEHERKRRSLTRVKLAALVRQEAARDGERDCRTDQKTIYRWERGIQAPSADHRRWLAGAMGIPVEHLSSGACKIGSREDDEAKRREFLAVLTAAGMGVADLERLVSPTVDAAYLRDAEAVTVSLLSQWYTASPAVLLPPVLAHLDALQARLPGPGELEHLTGRTALLAGHLLTMGRRLGEARARYALAESLARDIRDDSLEIASLICRSALYDWRRGKDVERSGRLVEAAGAMLNAGTPAHLRVWVLARRAEEHAAAGDHGGFAQDIAAAEAALRPEADHWYGPRDAAELAAVRGASELLLSRHADAADTLAWTLERMDPSAINWRTVVAADRDAALAALD